MSKFPLYDNFEKNVQNIDLTISQKNSFIQKIYKIDQHGFDLMYALIRKFQIEHETYQSSLDLPYNGKFIGKDINYNLELFPFKLKQLLYKFILAHIKKLKEEEKLINLTPVKRL
jgi:hypothetical protein